MVAIIYCKVHAEGTAENELNCGSYWDMRRQKGLASAQMLCPHVLPVPHFRKTRLGGMEEYLIPELLDIMAGVFYLIHGLYIVVTNNGK